MIHLALSRVQRMESCEEFAASIRLGLWRPFKKGNVARDGDSQSPAELRSHSRQATTAHKRAHRQPDIANL